ncbi:MAG: GAF domain-containing protein [Bacteroidia bacterium]|nr:GAF domain-containing protein [Bacteroidia bacterium]
MSEEIRINQSATREEIYRELLPQAKALLSPEPDEIARMANLTAILHEIPGFFWVGFYFVKGNELVLGPFQGPVACSRFSIEKGVCGAAVRENRTQIVPDVDAFPGHIACSSLSRSEIVLPIRDASGKVRAVLDIDSIRLDDFSEVDEQYLMHFLELVKLN